MLEDLLVTQPVEGYVSVIHKHEAPIDSAIEVFVITSLQNDLIHLEAEDDLLAVSRPTVTVVLEIN